MTIRTFVLKRKLARAMKKAWPVPAWVIMRTHGTFRFHVKRRHWRRGKIKT